MARTTGSIAFEIGPLITASGTFGDKSGVYRYRMGLLKGMIRALEKKKSHDKIILFTYNRDLLDFPLNPEIVSLSHSPNVEIVGNIPQVSGKSLLDIWRERILNMHPYVRKGAKIIAKIFKLNELAYELRNRNKFKHYLIFLTEVFASYNIRTVFHSETGFVPFPQYKNLITIYDLTAVKLSNYHRKATRDLQSRKLAFAKSFADGIICISESAREDLEGYDEAFKTKNTIVCYPGLDEAFSEDSWTYTAKLFEDVNKIMKKQNTQLEKGKYLLYYGTFEPRKNTHYIVKAFDELQQEGHIPSDFKLVMMGGAGWGKVRQGIENYINENYPIPSERNIFLVSFIDDKYLIQFIKNAYALVYPSLYEGFGLPILEAMALKTPVITSRISSMPEVGGERAVRYVDPHNFVEIKKEIKHLIKNQGLARQLGIDGYEQSKKFNWDTSAQQLLKFIKQL